MSNHSISSDLILALSTTDEWMQAAPLEQLAAHGRAHRGGGGTHVGHGLELDFYDASGHRLRPVLSMDLELVGFEICGPADPEAVEARIRTVIQHALDNLHNHPHYDVERRLSSPPSQGDLPALVIWVYYATTEIEDAHQSGWFHNLLHALVG